MASEQVYGGIINIGDTDFLSTVLQQMYMHPGMREFVLGVTDKKTLGHPDPSRPSWNELRALQTLFGELEERNRSKITRSRVQDILARDMKDVAMLHNEILRAIKVDKKSSLVSFQPFSRGCQSLDWENPNLSIAEYRGGYAQGSAAFLQTLLDRLSRLLQTNPQLQGSFHRMCQLELVSHVVGGSPQAPYFNCNYRPEEHVGAYMLPTCEDAKSLDELLTLAVAFRPLTRKVRTKDVLGRAYDHNVKVWTRTVFRSLPPFLMFELSRPRFTAEGNIVKSFQNYSIPLRLDMRPYCEEALSSTLPSDCHTGLEGKEQAVQSALEKSAARPKDYYEYELMGVTTHIGGSIHGGTNVAYIREREGKRNWYCFNDSVVTPIEPEDLVSTLEEKGVHAHVPYLLFYDRVRSTSTS